MRRRILARYLVSSVAAPTAAALLFVVFLFLSIEVFENQVLWEGSGGVVARYLLLRLPFIVYVSLPISSLVGVLIGATVLSRGGEITAARAGGVSLFALLRPILLLFMPPTILLFLGGEFLIPAASLGAEGILSELEGERSPLETGRFVGISTHLGGGAEAGDPVGAFLTADYFDVERGVMEDVVMEIPARDYSRLVLRLRADTLVHGGGGWIGRDVRRAGEGGEVESFDELEVEGIPPPEALAAILGAEGGAEYLKERAPEAESFSALARRRFNLSSTSGRASMIESSRLSVDIALKLAFPLVLPSLVILGFSLPMGGGRDEGIGMAVGKGVLVVLATVFLLEICRRLGYAASTWRDISFLAPYIGGWTPPLLLGGLGISILIAKSSVGE